MARRGSHGRASRSSRREELLARARSVAVHDAYDVVVVGGGAAGLVAAIVAAEADASVLMVEKDLECGRKVLATGNGRCNFANQDLSPTHYNDPGFVSQACGPLHLEDVLAFFSGCGMAWHEEDGRLYPLGNSASCVRDLLVARAVRAGVTLACGRAGELVRREPPVVRVSLDGTTQDVIAKAVVLATGSPLDGSPVLCPIACEPQCDAGDRPFDLASVDGRRVRARVTLTRDGRELAGETGELLFRTYGVSGICVFNLSRFAQAGDVLVADLVPTISFERLRGLLACAGSLEGALDPVVAQALGDDPSRAKRLALRVTGLAETSRAQVVRGGIPTSRVDPATLSLLDAPRVHVAGEAVDVDGPCGGYNLAWAWKSGMVAGAAAAAQALEAADDRLAGSGVVQVVPTHAQTDAGDER